MPYMQNSAVHAVALSNIRAMATTSNERLFEKKKSSYFFKNKLVSVEKFKSEYE
jgi:hypothetical protein